MEEFSIENVLKAVQAMYSGSAQANYKEIDNWLKNYQKSSAAWGLVSSIFSTEGLNEYVYIFNAQTLKTKLMYDFEELKGVDSLGFKNNILNLALKFADQDKVMRQLAQCIGILALHLSDLWGDQMLNEISNVLSGKIPLLLEVFKSIAEEIENQTIVVDSDKVKLLKIVLEKQASDIIRFLENCSSEYYFTILEVFLAWVQFGINEDVAKTLPQSRLLLLSFEAIKIPERFDTACGVLCELINLTENYEKFGSTVQILVTFLLSLKEEARKVMDDEVLIDGYIKLYTTLGNVHLMRIIEENSREVLEFLADLFAAKTSEGIYQLSQFWHRFCRVIRRKDEGEKARYMDLCAFLMRKLLPICLKHYQLTFEELRSGIEKDTEEIRYNVSVVIQDIIDVLSQATVLGMFESHLAQILNQSGNVNEYDKYSQIEAIAGCIISMAEISKHSELNNIYLQLSREIWPIPQVNSTICKIFASIIFGLPSASLTIIINYLVNCLKTQVPSKDVAAAIKNICIVNPQELLTHLPALLQLHSSSLTLPSDAQELILEGIANVLWRAPLESRAIFELCSVYAKNLGGDITEDELLFSCDKIALILKNSSEKEIDIMSVYYLFKEIWPGLKILVAKYEHNDNAVECICRIVKHAMKKLQLAFGEFLADFLSIISHQFVQYKHSSYLYMAEQLVKIFGNSNIYEEMLIGLFNTLTTVGLAELNSVQALGEKPEMTEDFFGMATRYLHYCPEQTLKSTNFERILILGKNGIGLQHVEAAKCLYGFLECTFDFCNKESLSCNMYAHEKLLQHYRDVLINLVAAVVSVVPGSIYEFIEEICYKILIIDEGSQWLGLALVNVPHDCLTEIEKIKFIQQSQSATNIHNWLERLYKRSKRRAMRLR